MRQPASPMMLETLPDPVPGPGEAVARVFTCGAGLTVQHIRAGRSPATFPRILGHEIAGEIIAIGPGVEDVAIGDEVTAYFYLTCGKCKWYRESITHPDNHITHGLSCCKMFFVMVMRMMRVFHIYSLF